MTTRLVTGASGLVGGAVVLELLATTGDVVHVLARGCEPDLHARVVRHLSATARGYGRPELAGAVERRIRTVRGDITRPACGVEAGALGPLAEVWHFAASLRHAQKDAATIRLHNVSGTRNVIELGLRHGMTGLNYCSTAYVGDPGQPVCREAPADPGRHRSNAYEQSKAEAESVVNEFARHLAVKILRPTIVVGHSVTRHCATWSGIYGFARSVTAMRRLFERGGSGPGDGAGLRLLGDPGGTLNLIPVDFVARNIVRICLSASEERYFHLANHRTRLVGEAVALLMGMLELPAPTWTTDAAELRALDQAFGRRAAFYGPYLTERGAFDLRNTDEICGAARSTAPLSDDELTAYLGYFLRQLNLRAPAPLGKAK